MSEPVAWNRAERRRRGMTRSRLKRTGSLASAGVLVSAGLFGAYVGNPRLQRAYAAVNCTALSPTATVSDDTDLRAALVDVDCTTITVNGSITLLSDLPTIDDTLWGSARETNGLTIRGASGVGVDTINGYDGSDNHGGLAITLANPLDDPVRLSLSDLTMANLQSGSVGAVAINVTGGAAAISVCGSYFSDNTAGSGGAIYATSTSPGSLRINDPGCSSGPTVFARNTATGIRGGGAIYTGLDAVIYDAEFTGNTATCDPMGPVCAPGPSPIPLGGGAIAGGNSRDDSLSVRVFESTFTDDTSAGDGGAISLWSRYDTTYLYLKDDTFSGNEAAVLGGAIRQRSASPQTVIQGSTFTNNTAGSGGAIYAEGLVRIDAPGGGPDPSIFSMNTASNGRGGAIAYADGGIKAYGGVVFAGNSSVGEGGAIYSGGRVDVSGVTFTENDSGGGGGAIAAYSVYADNGTQFLNNEAENDGGAIYSGGRVDVSGVTFTGNSSEDVGGAIAAPVVYANDGTEFLQNSTYVGGAISSFEGRVELDGVLIEGNVAQTYGGGIRVTSGLLSVSNSTFFDNFGGSGGGGAISSNDRVDVSGVTFTENESAGGGGAIAASLVYADNGTQFLNNEAENEGGAIVAYTVGLDGVLIEGNAANTYGGGVHVTNGLLTVSNSTIYGNSAGLEGGGIWSDDSVTVSYSAIIGNRAVDVTNGAGVGGGISAMGSHSEVLLTNSYVGGNQAVEGAGGIYLPGSNSHLGLYFTTVYDNTVTSGGGHAEFEVQSLTAVGSAVGNEWSNNVWSADVVDDTYFVSTDQSSGTWIPGSGSVELGPGVGLGLGVRDDTVTPGHAGRTPLAGSPLVTGAPSSSFGVLPAGEDQLGVSRVSPFTIGARQFVAPTPPPGPSILVTGTREDKRVRVRGATEGLGSLRVVPRYRFAGELKYRTGKARPRINATGRFTWQRKASRTIYVYFAVDGIRSNRLVLKREG